MLQIWVVRTQKLRMQVTKNVTVDSKWIRLTNRLTLD